MKRTTAPNSVGGAYVDKVPGVTIGTTLVAEDRNLIQEEICNVVEGAGLTLSGADDEQLKKAIAALIYAPGVYVYRASPVAASALFPCLRIDDASHDISTANWPDLVPYLRNERLLVNGESQWAVNVAGGVATFAADTPEDRLLAALAEEVLVHGGYGTWLALNLGGTDYAITNVNAGARTITVAAPPGNGGYTAIVYAYRVAGSATTARVRRMSGRALVGTEAESGDTPDRMLIAGLRARDRLQGHWHEAYRNIAGGSIGIAFDVASHAASVGAVASAKYIREAITDTVNGTPRTGKTTEPRTGVAFLYMGGGRYIP